MQDFGDIKIDVDVSVKDNDTVYTFVYMVNNKVRYRSVRASELDTDSPKCYNTAQ